LACTPRRSHRSGFDVIPYGYAQAYCLGALRELLIRFCDVLLHELSTLLLEERTSGDSVVGQVSVGYEKENGKKEH